MKIVKAKQAFKTVSAKQAENFPGLKVGTKRAALEFDLPEYEKTDLEMLVSEHSEVLLTCLNNATAQLAKDLFAAKPDDWNFVPSLESLNIEALKASFESVSRGRILTLESAAKLGTWLSMNIKEIVTGIQKIDPNYQVAQFQAIVGVISKFTAYESKSKSFMETVVMRLGQISGAIADSETLAADFVEDSNRVEVFSALEAKFLKAANAEEITEDAL